MKITEEYLHRFLFEPIFPLTSIFDKIKVIELSVFLRVKGYDFIIVLIFLNESVFLEEIWHFKINVYDT